MSDNAIITKYRGRPKGATSLTEITLADLMNKVGGDMNATIVVGRVWLAKRSCAVSEPVSAPPIAAQNTGIPQEIEDQLREEEPKIEFSIS